jgi:hypothetical protein
VTSAALGGEVPVWRLTITRATITPNTRTTIPTRFRSTPPA